MAPVFLNMPLFLSAITNSTLHVVGCGTRNPPRNPTLQTAASRGLSSKGIISQNHRCAYLFALWLLRQVCHISSNYRLNQGFVFGFGFVSTEACRLDIPCKNQAVIYLLHSSCVTIITLEPVMGSDVWLCWERCMKRTKKLLIFLLCNKPEIWREARHLLKLNHEMMTKREHRETHAHLDAMTQYYCQLNLSKCSLLCVTYIQQSNDSHPELGLIKRGRILTCILQGHKAFADRKRCINPPMG